ncbi:hypothetical protein J7E37_15845 [Bacillus sp. ISL-39]|nr:hypothetical protein [Bacillus sp. ISL-39]
MARLDNIFGHPAKAGPLPSVQWLSVPQQANVRQRQLYFNTNMLEKYNVKVDTFIFICNSGMITMILTQGDDLHG